MKQGSSAAVAQLGVAAGLVGDSFLAHRSTLLRFLTGRTGCRATAEDLAQEAFIRFQGVAAQVRSPEAFLFEIAGNLAVDHQRVQARRREIIEETRHILWIEADEITPEQITAGRQELSRMVAIVEQMPPLARKIFYLLHYEGLTQNDVAAALGVSRTTVQKHERRVMDRLADAAGRER